jgi:hypothetical protein
MLVDAFSQPLFNSAWLEYIDSDSRELAVDAGREAVAVEGSNPPILAISGSHLAYP